MRTWMRSDGELAISLLNLKLRCIGWHAQSVIVSRVDDHDESAFEVLRK